MKTNLSTKLPAKVFRCGSKIIKIYWSILRILILLFVVFSIEAKEKIGICYRPNASLLEQEAARTLSDYLERLFVNYNFPIVPVDTISSTSSITVTSYEGLYKNRMLFPQLPKPSTNGFIIRSYTDGAGHEQLMIVGDTPKATLDAVYALLEKLGYGFYLSYDVIPSASETIINFSTWEMSDAPLFMDRIMFNWFNFLSGCTGWNQPEWESWINQSAKMRYSAIMIHAYGNNPVVRFELNGQRKPIGYMNTSASGRDWGGQHINDVCRLPGGWIFDDPILGSLAAKVSDEQRAETSIKMMQSVFNHARSKGLEIIFALDFDTETANPQNIIMTLPESARFKIKFKEMWLSDPESPEGYLYYKEQIRQLLSDYPQITKLALWSRRKVSPWMSFNRSDLPHKWLLEYFKFTINRQNLRFADLFL